MKKLYFKKRAFSLAEMVVVIGLLAIITVVVAAFLSQSLKSYRIKRQSIELQEKAAQVMRKFEQTVRAGSKVISADQNELVFYRFFDLTSSDPTKVRYFIEGTQFKIGLTEPVGIAPDITYPSTEEKIDLIVPDVTNTNLLFRYYNGSSDELTLPVDTTSVRMVELTISLDQNGGNPPGPITETTKVNLRNMKDNL